jgi:hypothetical protein
MGSMDEDRRLRDRLADLPRRLEALIAARAGTGLRVPAPGGGWSPAAILAHLRASDDILAPRVFAMLARDAPPLPAYDDRRWAEVAGYAEADVRSSLVRFALGRAELVAMLDRFGPTAWERTGLHEERGTVSVRDVLTLIVEHEAEHLAQLEAALGGGPGAAGR